jgi:hypothetical protein
MKKLAITILTVGLSLATSVGMVSAVIPPPGPKNGSVGLEGKISSPPPTQAATITTPGNGATFTAVPITVGGLCPKDLLIKLFSNNVFVGSVQCGNGSYSLQVDLFSGQNDLVARVYDNLDQAGPDSNVVRVTFNDAQFAEFGTRVSLSSIYAKHGAPPGQSLEWPILLSGGTGPYAISVDWGDGSPTDLISQPTAGTINLKHVYKVPGIYKVIVKASDKNGSAAFLQLVAQATGAIQTPAGRGSTANIVTVTKVIWWPLLVIAPLLLVTFWIGRRHELFSLRRHLEQSRDS